MSNEEKIKCIINKFYEVLSGKACEERNWDQFRKLFFKHAYLIHNQIKDGVYTAVTLDVESYITRLSNSLKNNDFYEYAIFHTINIIGNIAQVYSSYEAKRCLSDTSILRKGTNFIQLVNIDNEWKIVDMLYEDN